MTLKLINKKLLFAYHTCATNILLQFFTSLKLIIYVKIFFLIIRR